MSRLLLLIVLMIVLSVLFAFALAGCGGGGDRSATPEPVLSEQGIYRVGWSSDPAPPPLNRLHTWTLHVEEASGAPVTGATLSVGGGMRGHVHGLAAQPRVTADLGNGDYRVDGMQFQMPGAWEVVVTVEAAAGADRAVLPLRVRP